MIGAMIAKVKSAKAMDALNRRDIPAFLADYADDAIFFFPGMVSASGTFRGKKAIQEWLSKFLDQFPKYTFAVKNVCVRNILTLGATNAVAIEWEFSYTNRQGTQDVNKGATVIDIRKGKIVRAQVYIGFDATAQKKAWGE